jgi:hypothetical protein
VRFLFFYCLLITRRTAINYKNVLVNFFTLYQSLRKDDKEAKVSPYVVNALCQKLSLDITPRVSKKHYFFSIVGASMDYVFM